MVLAVSPAVHASEALIGAGVRHRPVYDGAHAQTTDLIPVLRYYGRPWFTRTTQGMLEGGVRASLAPGVDTGLQLAYEQGPRDGDPGASFGAHLEWDTRLGPAPVNALFRLRRQLDSDKGTQADARLTAGVYEGHGLAAGIFVQATWADGRHFQAYYAVPESGLLFTSLGILGSYDVSSKWLALASLEARRLSDPAARSPFVQERSGYYFSAGLAYRF